METLYRLIYSVVVHWRTLLMMMDSNPLSIIGIDKEMVFIFMYLTGFRTSGKLNAVLLNKIVG